MRRLAASIACAVLFFAATGCGPTQADVEKSIRDGMKSQLNIEITAVDLKKQPDGTYAGTATAANGDVYDITTEPPSGGTMQWKALPTPPVVERQVKQIMEEQTKGKLRSLKLAKKDGNRYEGTAEAEDGTKLKVTAEMDGTQLKCQWAPAPE